MFMRLSATPISPPACGPRVASEHANGAANVAQPPERACDVRVAAMAFEVREEDVLPAPSNGGTRLDARQVDASVVEDLERAAKRAAFVASRENETRLVGPGRLFGVRRRDHDEARGVLGAILNVLGDDR